MRTRLAIAIHARLERWLPERRVFLRSDRDTRFIRLRPDTQLIALLGVCALVAWTIIATAILLMDSIGSGNFREQARRDQRTYEMRLNALEAERDLRAREAAAAHARFGTALAQISAMQSQLLASEIRRQELETGIEVIQAALRRTMQERDRARAEAQQLAQTLEEGGAATPGGPDKPENEAKMRVLAEALADTARERDDIARDAQLALQQADEMASRIRLMQDENDQIFRQLEEAMTISVEPLKKMFNAAGLDTEYMLDAVRRGYSGLGGPSLPIGYSTRGEEEPSPDALRAAAILNRMDRLNLFRIAAQKVPLAIPVKTRFRYTSGFGMRWGRMHKGTDFAGDYGAPIYATADGVVTHAGWESGYGRLVTIKHDFGFETRYAHMSRIRVKKGQRVSRGDRIGDMGSSGRSTGTHLHYEVRIDGKAVNPMTYIKAARDVF
ncbi:MAG: DUF5930 domain-containing protein [Roseovarius sp.]